MTLAEAATKLEGKFGKDLSKKTEFRGELSFVLPTGRIHDAAAFCKEALGFDYLVDVTGVDNFGDEPRFELVYERDGQGPRTARQPPRHSRPAEAGLREGFGAGRFVSGHIALGRGVFEHAADVRPKLGGAARNLGVAREIFVSLEAILLARGALRVVIAHQRL